MKQETRTRTTAMPLSVLFGLALALGLALGLGQATAQEAYAADGDIGVGSIWYVGDTFNPNGKEFYIARVEGGYLTHVNTIKLFNEDHKIQEPYWGSSSGWDGWVFKEMARATDTNNWCGLLFARTDKNRKPVGIRICEGIGVDYDEFAFEPVYNYHEHDGKRFRVWTGSSSLPKSAGNWFLDRDITLSETWTVPSGTTNLCLNGHKITYKGSSGNAITVGPNATLNLYDENENAGTITGFIGANGGAVLVNGGGSFTMNGGTITKNTANLGGGVYVNNGTFTMNGGVISNNIATVGDGGGVYVADNGTFKMNGGTIEGNKANKGFGGGVYVGNAFELAGGKVSGNTGEAGASSNVYLASGKTISVASEVVSGISAGVGMQTPGVFATGGVGSQKVAFNSDDAAYSVAKTTEGLALAHKEHKFSYDASGDTITATCKAPGHCALSGNPTLRIAAQGGTYDGETAYGATITATGDEDIRGDAKVVYQKKDGDAYGAAFETAPKNAGEYKASITLDSATASVEYAIAKAANPATVQPTATVKKGNSIDLSTCVSGATGTVSYAFSGENGGCSLSSSTLSTENATASSVTIGVTVAGDANHEALNATITVSIAEKATQTITASDVSTVFGTTDGVAVNANVTASDSKQPGTISYAVKSGSDDYIELASTASGALTIKKAGTAYVTVTAGETTDCAPATKDVKVTIAKADITPTVTISNWIYGSTANAPALGDGANPGSGAVTYEYKAKDASDSTYSTVVPTKAGEYTVRATVAETANYKGGVCTYDFAIGKKAVDAIVYAEDKVYDGATGTDVYAYVEDSALADGDYMMAWAPGDFADANAGENKVVTANEDKAVYYTSGEDNYEVTWPGEVRATIEKRPASVTAGEFTKTYGQADPKLTATASNVVEGEKLAYTLKRTEGEDVGSYPVAVNLGENPNYEVRAVEGGLYISRADLSAASATAPAQTYTGKALAPALTVKIGSATLKAGTDYTVEYADNTNVGTAKATVTGTGNYTGAKTVEFKIAAADLSKAAVTLAQTSLAYDGKAQKPAVKSVVLGGKTLAAGTDYTVAYKDNVNAGTATATVTGKGNYTGARTATFEIAAASVAKATVAKIANKTYTGKALKPAPKVTLGGKTLKAGTDYSVSYKNNKKAGTAKVTIAGKGNYADKKTVTFTVKKAANKLTVKTAKKTVKASKKAQKVKVFKKAKPKFKAKVTYKKATTAKAKKLNGYKKKVLSVNKKTGKITVKKNARPGTYKLMVKVTAAKTANTKAASKTVTVTVKVKAAKSSKAAKSLKAQSASLQAAAL